MYSTGCLAFGNPRRGLRRLLRCAVVLVALLASACAPAPAPTNAPGVPGVIPLVAGQGTPTRSLTLINAPSGISVSVAAGEHLCLNVSPAQASVKLSVDGALQTLYIRTSAGLVPYDSPATSLCALTYGLPSGEHQAEISGVQGGRTYPFSFRIDG